MRLTNAFRNSALSSLSTPGTEPTTAEHIGDTLAQSADKQSYWAQQLNDYTVAANAPKVGPVCSKNTDCSYNKRGPAHGTCDGDVCLCFPNFHGLNCQNDR